MHLIEFLDLKKKTKETYMRSSEDIYKRSLLVYFYELLVLISVSSEEDVFRTLKLYRLL